MQKVKRKEKTPEQKARDNNARLIRTYGITQAEYDFMLAEQDGRCKICGDPPKTVRLHVDHDHSVAKTKIVATKIDGSWFARAQATPSYAVNGGAHHTKSQAMAEIRHRLRRLSVRGLLDWKCNKSLKMFFDNPNRMETAAIYLRKYNEKLC